MWIWVLLSAVGTFVIAAVAIGSVTGRLARSPRRSVYDLEEAVEFVAERLPPALTAELSFDEVRSILGFHCDYLADKGLASSRTADEIGTGLVVVSDDEPVGYVIGRLEEAGIDIADDVVATVLNVENGYYEAIGAIGPQVIGPEDPERVEPPSTMGPSDESDSTRSTNNSSNEADSDPVDGPAEEE